MNKLIVMCGFPGAGKTTLLDNGTPLYPEPIIICPDEYRLEMTGHIYYQPAEDHVWATIKSTTAVLLKRHNVLIDGTHVSVGLRAQWIRIAKRLQKFVSCYWIKTPYETCCERNNLRERPVPPEAMERMLKSFDVPSFEEGFDEIVTFYQDSEGKSRLMKLVKPTIDVNIDLEQESG